FLGVACLQHVAPLRAGPRSGDLQGGERAPRIAGRVLGYVIEELRAGHERGLQATVLVRQRALEEDLQIRLFQRPQREYPAAREERGDHLEAGVLGGGADQRHRPALNVREQRVLLRLVEAVDLVDEEQRALA